jgi:hypothetical protein
MNKQIIMRYLLACNTNGERFNTKCDNPTVVSELPYSLLYLDQRKLQRSQTLVALE